MQENLKFEEAMQLLEDAIRLLESGTLSLDESIKKYEEAVAYVRICNLKLEDAEHRVRILAEGKDGAVSDYPFVGDEN